MLLLLLLLLKFAKLLEKLVGEFGIVTGIEITRIGIDRLLVVRKSHLQTLGRLLKLRGILLGIRGVRGVGLARHIRTRLLVHGITQVVTRLVLKLRILRKQDGLVE